MSAADRGRRLGALAALIEAHADELAQLESLDNGKPVTFARSVDVAKSVGAPRLLRRLADEDRGRCRAGVRARCTLLHRAASRSASVVRSFPGTSRC